MPQIALLSRTTKFTDLRSPRRINLEGCSLLAASAHFAYCLKRHPGEFRSISLEIDWIDAEEGCVKRERLDIKMLGDAYKEVRKKALRYAEAIEYPKEPESNAPCVHCGTVARRRRQLLYVWPRWTPYSVSGQHKSVVPAQHGTCFRETLRARPAVTPIACSLKWGILLIPHDFLSEFGEFFEIYVLSCRRPTILLTIEQVCKQLKRASGYVQKHVPSAERGWWSPEKDNALQEARAEYRHSCASSTATATRLLKSQRRVEGWRPGRE